MARWSSTFTAPALEWRVEPGRRPATGERRDGRPIGALVVVIGTLWLALPLPALLNSTPVPLAGSGGSGAWASLGIGLALLLWGLRILMCRQIIRIDGHEVQVQTRGLFGATTWREPLTRYRGLAWRSEPIERRDGRQMLHLVELWHEDGARRVTLLTSTSEAAARDGWQRWAQDLGLPAIRLRAGEQASAAREPARPLASTR